MTGTPDTTGTDSGGSFGRDFRLVLGGIALLANFVLYGAEHIWQKPPAPVNTHDVILHLAWAFCALFLMDPNRAKDMLVSLKDKIPGIKP